MKLVYHKTLDDIVVGCQRNDRNAQRQLYERLYGQMMALCMRYASDPQQAQEILNRGF
jgi:RNA polymerase sigma-70 factor (ECF subfamily)